ncbi:MAG: hypothetical protein JNM24_00495 [Bdellovibrionaceae bacterium]|nr:hypothetical protein [Pseudobdellovibrionaceae bacterium]
MNSELQKLILNLKERKALPKNMQMASVGPYCFANVFYDLNSGLVCESVACGFDISPDVALKKGLTEFFEGKAFSEGYKSGISSCQTERSDGFAAFPVGHDDLHTEKARKNALNEAVERFVWATWWDDTTIGHDSIWIVNAQLASSQKNFIQEMKKSHEVEKILAVRPHFENLYGETLLILVGFLKNGGVVSGGACGSDNTSIMDRALSELFRHGLAAKRLRQGTTKAQSFYERRLEYFATVEGQIKFEERLAQAGINKVKLPPIIIDEMIPHSFSDLFYVHRVLFQNQPPFIGGELERFCI